MKPLPGEKWDETPGNQMSDSHVALSVELHPCDDHGQRNAFLFQEAVTMVDQLNVRGHGLFSSPG